MPKTRYIDWSPRADSRRDIERAVEILEDFAARGYTPTLRQVYYQFVSRAWIPNTERSYKNLGNLLSQARRAGYIDWYHMVDRMRGSISRGHWDSPAEIMESAAQGYHIDLWQGQPRHVEVWVEKDALVDVISRPAYRWDVTYMACRGYMSDSEMWASAQRLRRRVRRGQDVVILHLGDHDPSGIDMTRDIEDRLRMFGYLDGDLEVRRIALNMDQVRQYDPPPNPAKITDSRAAGYIEEYGRESWELDALDPDVINSLITAEIESLVDIDLYRAREAVKERELSQLAQLQGRWEDVAAYLATLD